MSDPFEGWLDRHDSQFYRNEMGSYCLHHCSERRTRISPVQKVGTRSRKASGPIASYVLRNIVPTWSVIMVGRSLIALVNLRWEVKYFLLPW